jgi:hypothetical protein
VAPRLNTRGGFLHWTLEIPAWSILVALVMVPPAAFLIGRLAIGLANNDAEHDFPLIRNEVVVDETGSRIWHGSFLNPTDDECREVAATIRFLDADNRSVGEVRGQVERLGTGESLPLQGPLPKNAARMQVYSLQRRTGTGNPGRWFGPYRPWEFGYLMVDPAKR